MQFNNFRSFRKVSAGLIIILSAAGLYYTYSLLERESKGDPSHIAQLQGAPTVPQKDGLKVGPQMEQMQSKLTPDEARNLLAQILTITNIDVRAKKAADVIQRLCESGYIEEAWQLINAGAGQMRDLELRTWFKYAGIDFSHAVPKLQQLTDSSELLRGISGFLSSLTSIAAINALTTNEDFQKFATLIGHDSKNGLSQTLALEFEMRALKDPQARSDLLSLAIQLHNGGILEAEGVTRMLPYLTNMSAEDKWQILETSLPDASEKVRATLVQEMVDANPQAALSAIITQSGEHADFNLKIALSRWGDMEVDGANTWFQKTGNYLPSNLRDSAIEAMVDLALIYHESDGAIAWANQISDPTRKEETIKRLLPSPRKDAK